MLARHSGAGKVLPEKTTTQRQNTTSSTDSVTGKIQRVEWKEEEETELRLSKLSALHRKQARSINQEFEKDRGVVVMEGLGGGGDWASPAANSRLPPPPPL